MSAMPVIRRAALLLLVLALIAWTTATVWPTRWRYDHITYSGDTYPVRIDRMNGDADVLLPGDGWTPIEDALGSEGETVPDGEKS